MGQFDQRGGIDLNHAEFSVEFVFSEFAEQAKARVVDEDVRDDAAKPVDDALGTTRIGKILSNHGGSGAASLAQFGRDLCELSLVTRNEKEFIPVFRQQAAELITNPGGSACYQSRFCHSRYNNNSDVPLRRIALLVFLGSFPSALAIAGISAEQRRADLESFDRVWSTVREKHWDPGLGGVDWDAIRAELRPKIEHAESEPEVRAVLADMLSRLHLTHYGVIPAAVYRDVENVKGKGSTPDEIAGVSPDADQPEPGVAGIDTRVVNGEALVVSVDADSSAYRHGVRAGWVIQRIDDEDLAQILRRVKASYEHSTMQSLMLARAVSARLDGPRDNAVDVDFRDGRNRNVTLTLERMAPRGKAEKFGFMPESWLSIQTRQVGNGIRYIAFNYFLDPALLTAAFQQSIEKCAPCDGIVVDLRGNPGGIGILAMGLAGYFIDTPNRKLGTLYMRNLPMNFVVNPRAPGFRGKLAILIDGLSASTSEIFAGGMQDLKRARIFGSPSAGAALPSQFERLPNGDGFQYAMATYKSESGTTLEGTGVKPDVAIELTRSALLSGHDPALDAAVEWLQNGAAKGIISK